MVMLMIIMALALMRRGSLQAVTCPHHLLHTFQVESSLSYVTDVLI